MPADQPVRWGILGTANIGRVQFLPGLRQAGGTAEAVASRDAETAARYAADNGIARAVTGYQALLDDPGIDAVYIPLPNSLHADWTIAAMAAGKPVLCEKPLTGSLADTRRVLAAARQPGALLWEAFVFPFHAQMALVQATLADGTIGELREIHSEFHFKIGSPGNIRLSVALEGGALNDVGCYPIQLAAELFGGQHESAWATCVPGGDGVDLETAGVLGYSGGRTLLLSCGMNRRGSTFTRLLGSDGEIRMTNPFHPGPADRLEIIGRENQTLDAAPAGEPSFTPAIRHIQAVVRGEEEPRHLAADHSLPLAAALHDLHACLGR